MPTRTLTIHAKPSASRDSVERIAENEFTVSTTAPPIQGRANRAILGLLAEHLSVPVYALSIIRGHTSRTKLITVQ